MDQRVKGEPVSGLFGAAPALNQDKIKTLPEAEQKQLQSVQAA